MNRIWKILLPALAVCTAGAIYVCTRTDPEVLIVQDPAAETAQTETMLQTPAEIWVYVSGCVAWPGVYCLPEGARVYEAVEMAGGLTEDAAADALNLAQVITDGQQIRVPGSSQTVADTALAEADDGRININTATAAELMMLPGIGNAKAEAIVQYRSERPFRTIEEIMNVSGIKESTFERIKDLICI